MRGNEYVEGFNATNNPNLACIQVDDSTLSANHWKWHKDDHAHYSEDCDYTSVEEYLSEGTAINIFPNPVDKIFTVSFELETAKTITLTLTDLLGNEQHEFTLANILFVNEDIDVNGLSAGVYFLRISFGNEYIIRKVVVE